MARHDELLQQGPRDAPEPETVEEQSRKRGLKTAGGGGVAAGGLALAKVGLLGKVFIWFFAYRGVVDAWRIGGWIAAALVVAGIALVLVLRARRSSG